MFLLLSHHVESATKAVLFFEKREEKQVSENGYNAVPFIMVSKMHSKEPLTFCFYGILVYIMHFSLTVHI